MKCVCIIVLFNCCCEDSKCIASLRLLPQFSSSLHVFDNSTDETVKKSNLQYCYENELRYTDMHGNAGLTKVYNIAISHALPDTWIVLFDQDTTVEDQYMVSLGESIKEYQNIGLHVPIVESSDGRIISPSEIKGHRIINLKEIEPGEYKGITAINSGMAINKSVFDRVGLYNEEIFLDYLDHYFVRNYMRRIYDGSQYTKKISISFVKTVQAELYITA